MRRVVTFVAVVLTAVLIVAASVPGSAAESDAGLARYVYDAPTFQYNGSTHIAAPAAHA